MSHFPIIALILLLATRPALAATDPTAAVPTGRLIVTFHGDQTRTPGLSALQGDRKSTDSLHRERWQADRGLELARGLANQTDLLNTNLRDQQRLQHLAQQLLHDSRVESASVEYKRFPLAQPNDPYYRDNLTDPGNQSYLYEGEFSLRAPGAWDITTGSQNSIIAIIDTGVLPQHPELEARSISGLGYDFVSADQPGDFTSANDGDGRDANPLDPGDHCQSRPSSWHGTGVASVAAGNSNNSIGIAGIDWNARLLHARALGKCGGTDADIIIAIRWSAGLPVSGLPLNQSPATVINLSIGGPTECTPAWQGVIDELNMLGIPFVIAAGNEGTNALRSSPANCADVITVGSNTLTGDLDNSFSNYGLKVTIAAPGRDILVATNTGITQADSDGYDYHTETGSSFSAALVSGAISLIQSLNPDLSPAAIRAILQQSAVDFAATGNCSRYYCGAGILNLVRAMQMARDSRFDTTINVESNVVEAQVTSIEIGRPVSGELSGYRDMRYFKVTTSETGMLIISSTSDADLFGYLLSDNFSVIARDDDSHTALNFRVASRVSAGTYYVAVERSRHRHNDAEDPFELSTDLALDQPDNFSFSPVSNAQLNTTVASKSIVLDGLSDTAIITVTGGYYSVNGGDFTDNQGQVRNGDSLVVSLQSAPATNTQNNLTLVVGAYATQFSVTTASDQLLANAVPPTNSGCVLATQHRRVDPTLPVLLLLALLYLTRFTCIRKTNLDYSWGGGHIA